MLTASQELESKAVVVKGREKVELPWQGSEDAEHWLLKIMAVRQLLEHGYLARDIHVEHTVRVGKKRFIADVFAQKKHKDAIQKVWIECGNLDPNKEETLLNFFDGRLIQLVANPAYGSWNMTPDSFSPGLELWICVPNEIPEFSWGLRREHDGTLIFIEGDRKKDDGTYEHLWSQLCLRGEKRKPYKVLRHEL